MPSPLKACLDACVLYPTVLREILVGVAKTGAFQPIWSERILEEWARATAKLGPVAQAQARGEVAVLKAGWPSASVQPRAGDQARLWLPDENDVHVLATAIAGSCDVVVTLNAKDFPRATLAEEGLRRQSPDEFLREIWMHSREPVEQIVHDVHKTAVDMSGEDIALRALLKRARLPRLAKALAMG